MPSLATWRGKIGRRYGRLQQETVLVHTTQPGRLELDPSSSSLPRVLAYACKLRFVGGSVRPGPATSVLACNGTRCCAAKLSLRCLPAVMDARSALVGGCAVCSPGSGWLWLCCLCTRGQRTRPRPMLRQGTREHVHVPTIVYCIEQGHHYISLLCLFLFHTTTAATTTAGSSLCRLD